MKSLEKIAPIKQINVRITKSLPWYDKQLVNLAHKRNRLYNICVNPSLLMIGQNMSKSETNITFCFGTKNRTIIKILLRKTHNQLGHFGKS